MERYVKIVKIANILEYPTEIQWLIENIDVLSERALEKMLGIPLQTIYQWRAGKRGSLPYKTQHKLVMWVKQHPTPR